MGRDQRRVEITLEFEMSGLESTIRSWLADRARRRHIHMRGGEIDMRMLRVHRTASQRMFAAATLPPGTIPPTLVNYDEERRGRD